MSGIGEVLVSARSYREYAAMFDLADGDLAGAVLDCPGGASGFTDPDDHLRQRLDAVEVFAAGVDDHPERYVPGALPHLPFADSSFDQDWHLAALVELARVCARQVRVFPLVSHVDGQRHPHLERLRAALVERGIASHVRQVGHEVQRGGDEMLVLDVGPTAARAARA